MEVSRKRLEGYDQEINKAQNAAKKAFENILRVKMHVGEIGSGDVAKVRELAKETMAECIQQFGDMASLAAMDFFGDTADINDAIENSFAEFGEEQAVRLDRYVRSRAQHLVDNNEDEFMRLCGEYVSTEVHESANRTMRKVAKKYGMRYARVPMGGETCAFCLMLASRGFAYSSTETAGEGAHYHTHCRCKVVAGKPGSKVDGYDPDALYKQWKGMEKAKIDTRKLDAYSLNPNHPGNAGKAKGWKDYLGYTAEDTNAILEQVYQYLGENDPVKTDKDSESLRYQSDIMMHGKDGKIANVRVGWILDQETGKYRMTTIFVKPEIGD